MILVLNSSFAPFATCRSGLQAWSRRILSAYSMNGIWCLRCRHCWEPLVIGLVGSRISICLNGICAWILDLSWYRNRLVLNSCTMLDSEKELKWYDPIYSCSEYNWSRNLSCNFDWGSFQGRWWSLRLDISSVCSKIAQWVSRRRHASISRTFSWGEYLKGRLYCLWSFHDDSQWNDQIVFGYL